MGAAMAAAIIAGALPGSAQDQGEATKQTATRTLRPDLTVDAAYKPGLTCVNGKWLVVVVADITNKGRGTAVLPAEWTKPWVTAYPSKPQAGFVQPFYTLGKKTVLKKGETLHLEFAALFGEAIGGGAYDVIVKVDPYNVIKETNEDNNTGSFQVPGGC